MSVPQYERGESKLEALNQAFSLVRYTLSITSNPTTFDKKYYKQITYDIEKYAKAIYLDSWAANNVTVRDSCTGKEDYLYRLKLQQQAISNCTRMLACINIARSVFHFKSKRYNFWIEKIYKTRSELRKWRDNDKSRYKKIYDRDPKTFDAIPEESEFPVYRE